MTTMIDYDIIVAGSGVAGLTAALTAAGRGARTLLLTKGSLEQANTRYAQGGIAAALGTGDSPALHRDDTVAAGGGLVDERAAAILTSEAPAAIADLVRAGMPVDREEARPETEREGAAIALGREAAHSAARIVHAGGDATGAYLEQTLAGLVRRRGIHIREQALVTAIHLDRDRVAGVDVLDCATCAAGFIACSALILATGGAGQLYAYTTNPPVATGDGIALAYRAGAEVMDMEFIQFHPTALRIPGAPAFLISEAVRGEGAILRDVRGRAFMAAYDPRAELAPRDVVARAIHARMLETGADCVYLDLSHLPPDRVRARFPQIDRFCHGHGLDITRDLLPVAPAAHYTMGGVRTNTWGETNVDGLYACGEVACTGVHGANRLASNSLLEGLVFARRAAERATEAAGNGQRAADQEEDSVLRPAPSVLALPPSESGATEEPLTLAALQGLMWDRAGIVRDEEGLAVAAATLTAWDAALRDTRYPIPDTRQARELANLVLVARLVVQAARSRRESRGAHYRADYPEPSPAWQRHLVFRQDGMPVERARGRQQVRAGRTPVESGVS